jgi:hypothetical protein
MRMAEEAFELTLKGVNESMTAMNTVAATLTFVTTLKSMDALNKLKNLMKSKPLKFCIYGSFEDEVASVLRTERDRWKREAIKSQNRVTELEQELRKYVPQVT